MSIKKTTMLVILFFLPVVFLLFLYPSSHNYNPLDIIDDSVLELSAFKKQTNDSVKLNGNLTVLGFLGKQPMNKSTTALNLKELIYDKFKGFKRFQILILTPEGSQEQIKLLKKELIKYDELKYWHFAYGQESDILNVYQSLLTDSTLDNDLATDKVFIIDKDLNQRGRLDDRTDGEIQKDQPIYGLSSYNCTEVAEIKNKMSEDMRILFTEYRQKRKGTFDSSERRTKDIGPDEKE